LANAYTGAKKTEEEMKYALAKEMMGEMKPEDFEDWAKNKFVKEPAKMKLLIVCDKLLTGFDAPSAIYLYLDKKVVEHNLFQAICRVNRVNGVNKLFGYIIDYRKLFKFINSNNG
jgi:type I restriction enzyme R subunit